MERDTLIASALAIGIVLSSLQGCSASEGTQKVAPRETTVPPRFSKDVKPIDNLDQSALFLAHINLNNKYTILNLGNKLYVNDDVDRAIEVFGPPPKAYDVTELPPGWKDQGFKAAGWETSDEGFGAILQKDRVALAMFTADHVSDKLFDRLVSDYNDELGRKSISVIDKRAKYRFWTADDQTLMVSACNTPKSGIIVTVALGARPLMDALRMNPDRAKEDIKDATQLVGQRLKSQSAK